MWFFKKKRKQQKFEGKITEYRHDELAAHFFWMNYGAQMSFLRYLQVRHPDSILDDAKPHNTVECILQRPRPASVFSAHGYLEELYKQIHAGRESCVKAVLQNIFRDITEAEKYLDIIKNYEL